MKLLMPFLPVLFLTACMSSQFIPSDSNVLYDCSTKDKDAFVSLNNGILNYTLYDTSDGTAKTQEMESIGLRTLSQDDLAKTQKSYIDKAQNYCFKEQR